MNPRHEHLLKTLCQKVRLATADQAAAIMAIAAPGPVDTTRELYPLVTRDWLRRDRVLARLLPPFACPIATGGPGDPLPDFAPLVAALERRWDVAPEVTTVYRAGPAARLTFGTGGHGSGQNLAALGHDIACTGLYLAFAALHPERLAHWVGEDFRETVATRGEKRPDLILFGGDFEPYLVCELAGVYPRHRLEAFHAYCAETLNLPYELW